MSKVIGYCGNLLPLGVVEAVGIFVTWSAADQDLSKAALINKIAHLVEQDTSVSAAKMVFVNEEVYDLYCRIGFSIVAEVVGEGSVPNYSHYAFAGHGYKIDAIIDAQNAGIDVVSNGSNLTVKRCPI